MKLRRTDPHTLAGAYALDALSGPDRELFERHLGGCEVCRAEAAGLRDAAGRLADATAAVPPARLRGLVLAEAARTRQQPPPIRVAVRVRRSWHGIGWPAAPRLAVAIAGVGMLVALALGALLINTAVKLRVEEAHSREIAAILNAPDAKIMTVRAHPRGSATVVMSHAAHALVLTTARLPALPSTEVYQVWLMGAHRIQSEGKLPPAKQGMTPPMIIPGLAAGERMGVTIERSSGSARPSARMVLMLALPAD